jgi:hypothetical protein
MIYKRITILCGHYGSGKTNAAVNMAYDLKNQFDKVLIADLDIVNPYFRTKDSKERLEKAGIELISPFFANTNVDLPALPAEAYSVVQNKSTHAVLDIGGDDRGAYALGRYRPYILEENDFEMVFVANFYRPLTTTVDEAIEVMREIEEACQMKFTSIVNNSNLGSETSASDVEKTDVLAKELSEKTGLPLIFTTAEKTVAEKLSLSNVFPLTLQEKII